MELEIYFPVKGFRDWFRVFSSLRGLGFRLLSSKAGLWKKSTKLMSGFGDSGVDFGRGLDCPELPRGMYKY